MIYDRTQADADNANTIRETKIKKFLTLSDEDINTLERGMLTYKTLNRIENKQKELADSFNSFAYEIKITNKTNWKIGDDFYDDDFTRILNNTRKLYNIFVLFNDTPDVPDNMYSWQNVNAVEKILFDIENILDNMMNQFVYSSDNVYSGGI